MVRQVGQRHQATEVGQVAVQVARNKHFVGVRKRDEAAGAAGGGAKRLGSAVQGVEAAIVFRHDPVRLEGGRSVKILRGAAMGQGRLAVQYFLLLLLLLLLLLFFAWSG
jgi:hypothetical protein